MSSGCWFIVKSVLSADSEFDVIGSSRCFSRSSARGEGQPANCLTRGSVEPIPPWTNVIRSEYFCQEGGYPGEHPFDLLSIELLELSVSRRISDVCPTAKFFGSQFVE